MNWTRETLECQEQSFTDDSSGNTSCIDCNHEFHMGIRTLLEIELQVICVILVAKSLSTFVFVLKVCGKLNLR